MNRVLKNPVRGDIVGSFRGRKITFLSKASKIFDMKDEEQRAEYYYWKNTYDFVYDVTSLFKEVNKNENDNT